MQSQAEEEAQSQKAPLETKEAQSPQILLADTLYLLDGKKIQGKFLGIQDGDYKFKKKDGKILYIPEEQVDDLQSQAEEEAQSQKAPIETKEVQEKKEAQSPLIEEGQGEKEKEAEEAQRQSPLKEEKQSEEAEPRKKAEEPAEEPEEDDDDDETKEEEFQYFLSFSLTGGNSNLEYKDKTRASSVPYSLEGLTYPLAVEQYPNSYAGSSLRISAQAKTVWKPKLDIEAGLDYSNVFKSKNDRPIKVRGEVESMGSMLNLRTSYNSTLTYSYFSLFGGIRYSFPKNFYANPQIRIPLWGAYKLTERADTEFTAIGGGLEERRSQNTKDNGTIGIGGIGFGIRFGKEWPLSQGHNLGVEFSYSQDGLKLGSDGTTIRSHSLWDWHKHSFAGPENILLGFVQTCVF